MKNNNPTLPSKSKQSNKKLSTYGIRELFTIEDMTRNERYLLITLINFRNDQTGDCFPSYSTISESSGFSKSTIKRLIKSCEKKGYLSYIKGGFKDKINQSNRYTINIDLSGGVGSQWTHGGFTVDTRVGSGWTTNNNNINNNNITKKQNLFFVDQIDQTSNTIPSQIERLIEAKYPRKNGKHFALRELLKTVKTDDDVSKLSTALDNYLASQEVKSNRIMNLAKWVEDWKYWLEKRDPVSHDGYDRKKVTEELFERIKERNKREGNKYDIG